MDIHLYDEDEAPDVTTGAEAAVAAVEQTTEPSKETPVHDRRGYLGGSDAAVIAGLSPWKTPYQLYLEKIGKEKPADLSDNERVYWGQILEAVVAHEYGRRTGRKIRRVNKLLMHNEHPFIAAHIDRDVLNESRILEIKTAGRGTDWGEEETDEIPPHYYAQVQHYLAVTGADVCDVAVLIGGQQYRQYEVPRDDEYIAALIKLELDFWEHVQSEDPPTPETSAEANEMWPTTTGGIVYGDATTIRAAQDLYDVKAKIKDLEAQKDHLETQLKAAMEDIGDTLVAGKTKLATWKPQESRRFDSKAFAADNPELYERYRKPQVTRVFRLSYKPGKE